MFLPIDLTRLFPNLTSEGYRRTSLPTFDYNCLAWAAGDDTRRWDTDNLCSFWPKGTRRAWNCQNLVKIFEAQGYQRCADGNHEIGFEKVAIYVKDGSPTHAARQLADGKWTSKLGDLDDITHTLAGLIGNRYGEPKIYLRRQT